MTNQMEDEAMTHDQSAPHCCGGQPLREGATPHLKRLLAGLFAGSLSIASIALDTFADEFDTPAGVRDTAANEPRRGGFCSRTAKAALSACRNEVQGDFWIAKGNCINLFDNAERKMCNADAQAARDDGPTLCQEQYRARLHVCDLVGED